MAVMIGFGGPLLDADDGRPVALWLVETEPRCGQGWARVGRATSRSAEASSASLPGFAVALAMIRMCELGAIPAYSFQCGPGFLPSAKSLSRYTNSPHVELHDAQKSLKDFQSLCVKRRTVVFAANFPGKSGSIPFRMIAMAGPDDLLAWDKFVFDVHAEDEGVLLESEFRLAANRLVGAYVRRPPAAQARWSRQCRIDLLGQCIDWNLVMDIGHGLYPFHSRRIDEL